MLGEGRHRRRCGQRVVMPFGSEGEMFDRRGRTKALDLPMSRNDVADYLGLTIETVCRTLSAFKRDRVIAIPNPHRIELLDRDALEAVGEA